MIRYNYNLFFLVFNFYFFFFLAVFFVCCVCDDILLCPQLYMFGCCCVPISYFMLISPLFVFVSLFQSNHRNTQFFFYSLTRMIYTYSMLSPSFRYKYWYIFIPDQQNNDIIHSLNNTLFGIINHIFTFIDLKLIFGHMTRIK